MAITPGLIALTANTAAGYPAGTTNATFQTLSSLIGLPGSLGVPAWLLAGTFKGIFFPSVARPVPSTLNSGDYYFDVLRGSMLVTDGMTWCNIASSALPLF